jgi:N-acetylglutamate synthase-like GNAT family acetyltransferase
MALAAVGAAGDILGVARLAGDPQGETAEFALLVRSDHQRRGLGRALMEALIAYARARGYRQLWGAIAAENRRMLDLAGELGFETKTDADDAAMTRATLALASAAAQRQSAACAVASGDDAASPTERPSTIQTAVTPSASGAPATQVTSRANAVAISAPRGRLAPASVRRTRTQRSGVGPEATQSVRPSITCNTVPENASPRAGGAAVQAATADGSSRAGCGAGGQVSGCAAVAAIIAITANCTSSRSLNRPGAGRRGGSPTLQYGNARTRQRRPLAGNSL